MEEKEISKYWDDCIDNAEESEEVDEYEHFNFDD